MGVRMAMLSVPPLEPAQKGAGKRDTVGGATAVQSRLLCTAVPGCIPAAVSVSKSSLQRPRGGLYMPNQRSPS